MKLFYAGILTGYLVILVSFASFGSEIRICASYYQIARQLLSEGETYWWSYRPEGANHRVEYWRNLETGTITIFVSPSHLGRLCVLGGGNELEMNDGG